MASVLSVDAQGVQLVLGADTAELQAELMQERQARIAGDNALRSSIADEVANQRGDPTSIVEVDVNGLDVVTTTRGGDNETESVVLPSLIADVRQTTGGIEVDTREASGAHSTKTIQVAGTGTVPGSFTGLDDTPSDYSAGAGQVPVINADGDGLAFAMPQFQVTNGTPFQARRAGAWQSGLPGTTGNLQSVSGTIASHTFTQRGIVTGMRAYLDMPTSSGPNNNESLTFSFALTYPNGTTINGNAVANITGSREFRGSPLHDWAVNIPTPLFVAAGTTAVWSIRGSLSGSGSRGTPRVQLGLRATIEGTFFPADTQTIADIRFTDLAQTPAALGTPGQQLLVNAQRDALFFADQYPARHIAEQRR